MKNDRIYSYLSANLSNFLRRKVIVTLIIADFRSRWQLEL